ncbi:MAG: ABC transporter permease [Thermoleophilia bacterium]|nr:ABC transporter permease [Thermoleophilia bacterium]
MSDVFLSRSGRRALLGFFGAFLIFLYAPTLVLVMFSLNDSAVAGFPFVGATLRWYSAAVHEPEVRKALLASIEVGLATAFLATGVALGVSYALARRRFPGRSVVSALALLPLVVPTVVMGVSLLVLFRPNGPVIPIPLSLWAVLIGHVVVALPFCILILMPRIASIDRRLEEAAEDLGASWWQTFRLVVLPLIGPAVVSSLLVGFVTSVDEVVIASFLVGDQVTLPVYLYSGLRFAERTMMLVPVASVMIVASFVLVVAADLVRRAGDRRLGAA